MASLTERAFAVLDVLARVASELGTTPARVALAWVQGRPGVTSTIIGVRTMAQLDDNLGALDLRLPAEHVAALEEVSRPQLNFPADFVSRAGLFSHGGCTINGTTYPTLPAAPRGDEDRH
jgi:diketogulonate reductase-like aldo/keto reductase